MTVFALTIDGTDVSSWTMAQVRASVGRRDVWSDPEAGTMTVTMESPTVESLVALGRRATLTADGWVLFSGLVTDVTAQVDSWGMWRQTVIAAGPFSELARTPVGDEPWPQQTDSRRIRAILTAAGQDITAVPDTAGPDLLPRDVDRQPALNLLLETASSGGGLLFEDHPGSRVGYQPALLRIAGAAVPWDTIPGTWNGQTGTWDEPGVSQPEWVIPADAVMLDPWTFEQHAGDRITWAEVGYGTSQEVIAGDRTPPVYGAKLRTQLADVADAQERADRVIRTRNIPRWSTPETVLLPHRLPDPTVLPARLLPGALVRIDDLPPGSPMPALCGYIEGWDHDIAGDADGWSWRITLAISEYTLTAPATTWDQGMGSWDSQTGMWNTLILAGGTV